jgi:hypothetical protein
VKIKTNKNREHIKNNNNNKSSLHHVCFHWGLFNEFSSQIFFKKKEKKVALRLCVSLLVKRNRGTSQCPRVLGFKRLGFTNFCHKIFIKKKVALRLCVSLLV